MTYDTFKQEVLAELQNLMGSDFDISTKEILKNNNLRLDGLIMSQSGLNISPTIYLNYYYDMYQQNTYDFHEIVQQIVNCYEQNKMDEDFDIESFTLYTVSLISIRIRSCWKEFLLYLIWIWLSFSTILFRKIF